MEAQNSKGVYKKEQLSRPALNVYLPALGHGKTPERNKDFASGGMRISLITVVSSELKPCSQIPKEN